MMRIYTKHCALTIPNLLPGKGAQGVAAALNYIRNRKKDAVCLALRRKPCHRERRDRDHSWPCAVGPLGRGLAVLRCHPSLGGPLRCMTTGLRIASTRS